MIDKINRALDMGWRVNSDWVLVPPEGEPQMPITDYQLSICIGQLDAWLKARQSVEVSENAGDYLLNHMMMHWETYVIECEGDLVVAADILCMDASVDLEVDLEIVRAVWDERNL